MSNTVTEQEKRDVSDTEMNSSFNDDATVNGDAGARDGVSHSQSGSVSEKKGVAEEEVNVNAEQTIDPYDVPDGGLRAWLVVMGASFGTLATFGFVNAWGVFQSYYEESVLPDTSPSTIAWIGSIQYSLIFIPGLIAGRLFDMGWFKLPLAAATAFLIAATFLVAQCTEYWQFLLCQGFAVGLSCGMIFGPLMGIVAHWFKKKRGVALGVVAVGSSIGGTVFPIAARNLIVLVGFPWTMRILGFILLVCLGVTNLTVARRFPPKKELGPFFDLSAFKYMPYTIWCMAGFVSFLGLYTVLTYIDISAVAKGIPSDFSFYLVSIANAASGVGRLCGGLAADRLGPINVIAPATLVAAILTYAWPFAESKGAFIAIAIIYGMASGVFVSLLNAPTMAMGNLHDVGVRVGMAMTILALGALAGPPISGAIEDATGGFKAVGYYAGSMVVLSVVLAILTRQLALKRLWGKY
ncbi:MFS general substrate transporter [Panus rudis PR-1116 ss-1]|nr:MFS general substrate transporter [Panus rudis PR-1116 ss-1]